MVFKQYLERSTRLHKMEEIKATSGLTEIEEAHLLSYIKATKMRVGLLLNFGKKSLEVKRRIL